MARERKTGMNGQFSGISRRAFLGMGAVGVASQALAANPKKKSGNELLNIGLILGEWSHSENAWTRMINGVPNVNDVPYTPKRTGMYYTHVWHIDQTVAKAFADRFNVPNVVKSFDGMVGKVDGIIIDVVFQIPWTYKLARPYLENGIPVYIDRPFTDSLRKAREMTELSKKYNTPVWSGSSLEHMCVTYEAIGHNPPESILGYETWSEGVPDYYTHGLHGIWWAYRTAGGGIHAIAQKTDDWSKGSGTSTIVYNDRGKGPFLGTINHTSRDNTLIYTQFKGQDRIFLCDGQTNWDEFVYGPMLTRIQGMFELGIGGMPETHESLIEKLRLFLAGFRSILREKGEFVELKSLDEDWSVGCPWGQSYMPGMEAYQAYTKLLGAEKGEIRPPK
ncbi:Gfo/Idh/MocA family oxidoreductase [bacterium]|nr:Gfo/Idh/MocA family oxidoreductase [bacterium]